MFDDLQKLINLIFGRPDMFVPFFDQFIEASIPLFFPLSQLLLLLFLQVLEGDCQFFFVLQKFGDEGSVLNQHLGQLIPLFLKCRFQLAL